MLNDLLGRGAKSCGFDLHWHSDGKLDITQKQLEQLAVFLTTAERAACLGALEVVMLMAKNGNYSGQEEAVQECLFALQERSNVFELSDTPKGRKPGA